MIAVTYEQRRRQATRPDLWPEFAAAPAFDPCDGGDDCDCHDEDDDDR